MQTEFEVKFVDLEHDDVRAKLKAAGAELAQAMRVMRREIFDYPDGKLQSDNSYIRIRDEGDKISLTFKQFADVGAIDAAKEIEFNVSNMEAAKQFLLKLGLEAQSYQESKRETWHLDGGEVVLDEWPWLKPYIEIEADSEAHVKNIAAKLGFDWADAVFGDVVTVYRLEYDVPEKKVGQSTIRFEDPRPDWMVPRS